MNDNSMIPYFHDMSHGCNSVDPMIAGVSCKCTLSDRDSNTDRQAGRHTDRAPAIIGVSVIG